MAPGGTRYSQQLLCVPAAPASPKSQGQGGASLAALGTHLLGKGSLLILQALKGGIYEAPKQEALLAPGTLGKGQRHQCSGIAPRGGTGGIRHTRALPS